MRTRNLSVVVLLSLLLMATFGPGVDAMLVRAGEDVFVAEDESLTEDMALFASTISVDGYVDADVIAFSRSLFVNGVINQDLIGGAETIDLTGQVGDDVRVGGRSVTIRGPVGDDVVAFCQRFTLGDGGLISGEARVWCAEAYFIGDVDGNLRTGCERAEIHGHVGGNVTVDARTVKIEGAIDGDAQLKAETIILLPGCIINGDLNYTSTNEIEIHQGAQILGQIDWQKAEAAAEKRVEQRKILQGLGTIWVFLKVAFFFGQIIVGLILLGIFRTGAGLAATTFWHHLWKSLGIGFVFACCAIIACFILPFTVIGLPLAILLICFSMIIWYLGPILVALALGGHMVGAFKENRTGRLVGGMILGLFILRALSFIPILGWLIQILVVVFGMGGILICLKSARDGRLGRGTA